MGPWLGLALPLISFHPPGKDKQGWFSSLSPPAGASCATAAWVGRSCHQPRVFCSLNPPREGGGQPG